MQPQIRVPFTPSPQLNVPLEQALLYAVELLCEMDWTLFADDVPVVPSTLVWMIDRYDPAVLAELRTSGQIAQFTTLLADYDQIRALAVPIQINFIGDMEAENCCEIEDPGHLDYVNILTAVDRSGRSISPDTKRTFRRVLSVARARARWYWSTHFSLNRDAATSQPQSNEDNSTLRPLDQRPSRLEPTCSEHAENTDDLRKVAFDAKTWLIHNDDGQNPRYWHDLQPDLLGARLAAKCPELRAQIETHADWHTFDGEVDSFVRIMRQTELMWDRLSQPLRTLLSKDTAIHLHLDEIVRPMVAKSEDPTGNEDLNYYIPLVLQMIQRRTEMPKPDAVWSFDTSTTEAQ